MENKKVIVVTGGTQGLGEGIARHLAGLEVEGLVICGRNQERGQQVAAELEQAGCKAIYVPTDLEKEADCRRVIQVCDEQFGRVDGLVNAAGVTTRGTLEDTSVELWDQIFAVNTRAPFILMQEAVRVMKREGHGGSIVNILSMSAHGGQPFITAYCASKGALATLTKNAAHALRFDHIRVNGLNIGWTYTTNEHAVQMAMGKPENWLEQAEAKVPFKRILRPRDVAGITAYLLSDESEMMTGSLIDFDQHVIGNYDS
ncbi:MAG: SDR family oxidoreductase [Chloroflexi bacterium]|nr:SDR family oxidoreductase [Chloroflexota bacterium]